MTDESDVQILTDPVNEAVCPKCSHKTDVQGMPSFSSLVCAKCGHSYEVPARLGNFLLLRIIGMGGMGAVYRAHDKILNRAVAIKVMRKSLGDNVTFSETFLREAQAAARINHPNIVQIYSFGKEKGQPYIVMELVLGGGMDKLMEAGKPVDQKLILRIAEQVADGLRHASDEGMMHGDVKPENILITENRTAKLVDFGLASVSGTASNEIWGTPFYIAPEKVRRQKADHRADIYSLGGTLYHALAAQPPFDGVDANAVVRARFVEPLKPLTEVRPDIDPEVSAIISRMLLTEPALRYPTYGSLLSDIRRVLERLGPEEEPAPVSKKIILRRKNGSKVTPSQPTTANNGPGSVPSEKKIVIGRGLVAASGHQSGMLTGPQMGVDTAASTGQVPLIDTSPDDPAKRMRLVKLIATLAVVGLLAIIGGLFGLVKWRQSHIKGKEAERQQVEQQRQDAIFSLSKIEDRAKRLHEQCVADAEKGRTLATTFVAEATDLIPAEVRDYLVPPRPAPPPEEIPVAEETVAAAPAAETKEDAVLLAKAAAAVSAAGLPLTRENIAMFAKSLTPAAADSAVANDEPEPEAPAEELAADVGAAAEEEHVADAAAAPLDESALPPVVQRIRSMFMGVYKLELATTVTATLIEEIELALQDPNIPKRPLDAVQALHAELTAKCDTVATQSPVADADRLLRGIEADRDAAAGLLSDVKARLERQARETQARAEAEAAALAKQRQEQERQQQIEGELGSVIGAEAMNLDLLRTLEFRQAARALRTLDANLKTDEGKAALAVAQERVTRIEEFYQFLGAAADGVPDPAAEGVDADRAIAPFRHPIQNWVIEKSDARTVTVHGKTVDWDKIDDVTKVMIIRFLLMEDKQVTALRFRYRIRQYINAALFLDTFITDSPAVKQMAITLSQEAINMFQRSREEIDRLIPNLLQAEG